MDNTITQAFRKIFQDVQSRYLDDTVGQKNTVETVSRESDSGTDDSTQCMSTSLQSSGVAQQTVPQEIPNHHQQHVFQLPEFCKAGDGDLTSFWDLQPPPTVEHTVDMADTTERVVKREETCFIKSESESHNLCGFKQLDITKSLSLTPTPCFRAPVHAHDTAPQDITNHQPQNDQGQPASCKADGIELTTSPVIIPNVAETEEIVRQKEEQTEGTNDLKPCEISTAGEDDKTNTENVDEEEQWAMYWEKVDDHNFNCTIRPRVPVTNTCRHEQEKTHSNLNVKVLCDSGNSAYVDTVISKDHQYSCVEIHDNSGVNNSESVTTPCPSKATREKEFITPGKKVTPILETCLTKKYLQASKINSGKYRCSVCKHRYIPNKHAVMEHIRRRHTHEKPYRCDKCSESFIGEKECNEHRRQCSLVEDQIERGTKADSLGTSDQNTRGGMIPQQKTKKIKKLNTASTRSRLQTHQEHFSNNNNSSQKLHGRVCKKKNAGMTKLAKCPSCGKFMSKWNLNRHVRLHTGEKPFSCSICNQRFSDKGNCKKHERRHAGNEPIVCFRCNTKFVEFTEFEVHQAKCLQAEKGFEGNTANLFRREKNTGQEQDKARQNRTTCEETNNSQKSSVYNILRDDKLTTRSTAIESRDTSTGYQCGKCHQNFPNNKTLSNHEMDGCERDSDERTAGDDEQMMQMNILKKFSLSENKIEHDTKAGFSGTSGQNSHGGVSPQQKTKKVKKFSTTSTGSILKTDKEQFSSTSNLRMHEQLSKKRKGAFRNDSGMTNQLVKCGSCKKYLSKWNLNRHMRVHSGEKPYGCSICSKRFSDNSNRKAHEKRWHTGHKPITCFRCNKRFSEIAEFQVHQAKCPKADKGCEGNTPNKIRTSSAKAGSAAGTSHQNTHRGVIPQPKTLKKFNTISARPTLKTQKKKFSSNSNLKKYGRLCKKRKTSRQTNKRVQCGLCDKFMSRWSLLRHMRIHTGEKPFICSICNLGFSDQGNCRKHEKRHTGNEKFACLKCTKKFSKMSKCKEHQVKCLKIVQEMQGKTLCKETNGSPESSVASVPGDDVQTAHRTPMESCGAPGQNRCGKCHQNFQNSNTMSKHERDCNEMEGDAFGVGDDVQMNMFKQCNLSESQEEHETKVDSSGISDHSTHGQVIPEQKTKKIKKLNKTSTSSICKTCKKHFPSISNLRMHERLCKSKRTFNSDTKMANQRAQCGLCDKYLSKYNLDRHMRLHTGEKPFGCSICNKRFSDKSNCTAHEKQHTGNRPFSCLSCNKKFTEIAKFNVHKAKCVKTVNGFEGNTSDMLGQERKVGQEQEKAGQKGTMREEANHSQKSSVYNIPGAEKHTMRNNALIESRETSAGNHCGKCHRFFPNIESVLKHEKDFCEKGSVSTTAGDDEPVVQMNTLGQVSLSAGQIEHETKLSSSGTSDRDVRNKVIPEQTTKKMKKINKASVRSTCRTGKEQFSSRLHGRRCKKGKRAFHSDSRETNQRIQCGLCDKFMASSSLNRHMRIHTGERPFSCAICNMGFSDQGNCRKHERRHTVKRRFACLRRNKKTSTNSEFKVHQVKSLDMENVSEADTANMLGHERKGGQENDKAMQDETLFKETNDSPKSSVGIIPGEDLQNMQHRTPNFASTVNQCNSICHQNSEQEKNSGRVFPEQTTKKLKKPTCKTCKKQFPSISNLRLHERMCKKRKRAFHRDSRKTNQRVQCGSCDKFMASSSLNRHMILHTGEKPFGCSICNERFSDKSNCKAHEIRHTGNRPLACSRRDKKLSKHQVKETNESPKSSGANVPQGDVHTLEKTPASTGNLCEKCPNNKTLLKHESNCNHGNEKTSDLVARDVQMDLLKQYSLSEGQIEHETEVGISGISHHKTRGRMNSEQKIKKCTCKTCKKQFPNIPNLRLHERLCRKRKRAFHSDARVNNQHVKCGTCGKVVLKGNIKRHSRVHTGETPFSCSICNKKFSDLSNCKAHERRRHTDNNNNNRPFACFRCDKKFSDRSDCTVHQAMCLETENNREDDKTNKLEQERKTEHENNKTRQKKNTLKTDDSTKASECSIPGNNVETMRSSSLIETHVATSYQCTKCNRIFPNSETMIMHEKVCCGKQSGSTAVRNDEQILHRGASVESFGASTKYSNPKLIVLKRTKSPVTKNTGSSLKCIGSPQADVKCKKVEISSQRQGESCTSINLVNHTLLTDGKVKKKFVCELCNVQCAWNADLLRHNNTKKHKRNLESLKE